jgi:hypothetical protein
VPFSCLGFTFVAATLQRDESWRDYRDERNSDEDDEEQDEDEDDETEENDNVNDNEHEHGNEEGDDDEADDRGNMFSDEERMNRRRQAMVENLIGMGFPVEWALRAAAQNDSSVSESSAIAWIIERMELEHNKLADIEGRDSRNADDEENEENAEEAGLEYLMHRHVAAGVVNSLLANTSSNYRDLLTASDHHNQHNHNHAVGNSSLGNLELATSLLNSTANTNGADPNSSANKSETSSAASMLLNAALLLDSNGGLNGVGGAAGGQHTSRSHRSKSGDYSEAGEWLQLNGGHNTIVSETNIGAWDADIIYPPVLLGHYTARHRHDMDKQEVLAQIQDLEQVDMIPIISSCQFSLCIFYARAIILRAMGMMPLFSPVEQTRSSNLSSPADNDENKELSVSLLRSFGSSIVYQIADQPDTVIRLLMLSFRQYVSSIPQPDRLLPFLGNGNLIGDLRDRIPCVEPFHTGESLWGMFNPLLGILEQHYFRNSRSNISVEESSVQGIRAITLFVRSLVMKATCATACRDDSQSAITVLLNALIESCVRCIEDAGSSLLLLQSSSSSAHDNNTKDWISTSLEREDIYLVGSDPATNGTAKSKDSVINGTYPVLWAYTMLRLLLAHSSCSVAPSAMSTSSRNNVSSNWANTDPFVTLISPTTMSRLLKATMSANRSIKFCAFDICALILARLNGQLLEQVNKSPTPNGAGTEQPLSPGGGNGEAGLDNDISFVPVERACDPPFNATKLATNYQLSVAKEKRLLQLLGSRLRMESSRRVLYSRYTRSIAAFLLQWQLMRRSLTVIHNSSNNGPSHRSNNQSSENVVNKYITGHWTQVIPTTGTSANSAEATASAGPHVIDRSELEVIQITSSSITIHWWLHESRYTTSNSSSSFGGSLMSNEAGFALYIAHASNVTVVAGLESVSNSSMNTAMLVRPNIDTKGTHRIDNLDPGNP